MFYPQKRVLPTLGLVQEVLCQSARALTEQAYGLPPRLSEKDLEKRSGQTSFKVEVQSTKVVNLMKVN